MSRINHAVYAPTVCLQTHPATATVSVPWHTLAMETVCSSLNTTRDGLSKTEAERRLVEYGPNELQAAHRISPYALLLAQFKNVLIIVLLTAAALSSFLGHGAEAVANQARNRRRMSTNKLCCSSVRKPVQALGSAWIAS